MVRPGDAYPPRSFKSRIGNAGRWISGVLSGSGDPRSGAPVSPSVRGDSGRPAVADDFAGQWLTTFGVMNLTADGSNIRGSYGDGGSNTITGVVSGGRLDFSYQEASEAGTGSLQLLRHGAFAGEYMAHGAGSAHPWTGSRGFDGLWETSFGRMRLFDESDRIHGSYNGVGGHATILGTRQGDRLVFRYEEAKAGGEGWFALDADMLSYQGQWRKDGTTEWAEWVGKRVEPQVGVQWLVVLEVHWQQGLGDPDFAFGFMLRELFARLPRVKVRHRFFDDEAGLMRHCQELAYLAEPVVVVITSHGEPEGLSVNGAIIDSGRVIDTLRFAPTLELLHFSCCLIGQDAGGALAAALFPVSGYITSVDWAQSAMTEFIYLDMVLGKHLPPAEAAAQLVRLVAFAGDGEVEDSPYEPAGFRFFGPTAPQDEV